MNKQEQTPWKLIEPNTPGPLRVAGAADVHCRARVAGVVPLTNCAGVIKQQRQRKQRNNQTNKHDIKKQRNKQTTHQQTNKQTIKKTTNKQSTKQQTNK